jgi:Arc/MetJ-type ribon-helix-helix transcriptional regulator
MVVNLLQMVKAGCFCSCHSDAVRRLVEAVEQARDELLNLSRAYDDQIIPALKMVANDRAKKLDAALAAVKEEQRSRSRWHSVLNVSR